MTAPDHTSTPSASPDLSRHEALMVRAVPVIDSFDDIDDMAEIGTVLDDLVEALDSYRDAAAVVAVRDLVAADRVASMLSYTTTPAWRASWLRHHAGCDEASAERVMGLEPARWATLAADENLAHIAAMTLDVADGLADDLERLLAPHTHVETVPDTIPAGWL